MVNIVNLSLHGYFICGIVSSFLAFIAQKKRIGPASLFLHGKSAISGTTNELPRNGVPMFKFTNWLASLVVPKRIFWHFYAFGLVCIALKEFVFPTPQTSLVTLLLVVQCLRRLCECFWVMPGGRDSKMHLIHYLIGITYYPVLLLSFSSGNFASYSPKTDWTTWCFILLFISSSLVQFYCHLILGLERKRLSPKPKSKNVMEKCHRPINCFPFKFLHAPHYTAELGIYLSIAGINSFRPVDCLNLLWILSILGVSACNSADFLCKTGRYKTHKEFCQYLMIPFLF